MHHLLAQIVAGEVFHQSDWNAVIVICAGRRLNVSVVGIHAELRRRARTDRFDVPAGGWIIVEPFRGGRIKHDAIERDAKEHRRSSGRATTPQAQARCADRRHFFICSRCRRHAQLNLLREDGAGIVSVGELSSRMIG